MSQVTDALRGILQGFVASQPFGSEMIKSQQAQEQLEQEAAYKKATIANEQQRLKQEAQAHADEVALRQHDQEREKMLANLTRSTYLANLSKLSPQEISQIPGVQGQEEQQTIPGTGGPGQLPAYSGSTGMRFTLPVTDENNQPYVMHTPTQETYLKNVEAEQRAKEAPQLDILQQRLASAQELMTEKLNNALAIAQNTNSTREQVAQANREASMYKALLQGMFGTDIAKLKLGLTGDTQGEVNDWLDKIKRGTISQNDLQKELRTRPGVLNQIVSGASAAGLHIPTDQERDIVQSFAPAKDALRQIHEFNDIRQGQGVGLGNFGDLNQRQNQIHQVLATVERGLLNTRLSNQQAGFMTGAYTPNMTTLNPLTNTNANNREKEINLAKYLQNLVDTHLRGFSEEQKKSISDELGFGQYIPNKAPAFSVGQTVMYNGKPVKITKLHPDGKTFDYEEVKK